MPELPPPKAKSARAEIQPGSIAGAAEAGALEAGASRAGAGAWMAGGSSASEAKGVKRAGAKHAACQGGNRVSLPPAGSAWPTTGERHDTGVTERHALGSPAALFFAV